MKYKHTISLILIIGISFINVIAVKYFFHSEVYFFILFPSLVMAVVIACLFGMPIIPCTPILLFMYGIYYGFVPSDMYDSNYITYLKIASAYPVVIVVATMLYSLRKNILEARNNASKIGQNIVTDSEILNDNLPDWVVSGKES